MKKIILLCFFLFAFIFIYAQQTLPTSGSGVIDGPTLVITASKFQVTHPENLLYIQQAVDKIVPGQYKERQDKSHRLAQKYLFTAEDGPEYGNDPASMQTDMGTRSPLDVITSWNGQTGGWSPEDPSGAAGLTQYVQAVNSSPFKVYNKTGNGTAVFTGDIGTVTGSGNDGDPIVLYDKFADRWFVGQMDGWSGFAVAVSATNNPAGAWYAYQFNMPSGHSPDYLKFSVWENGYYMTSNNGYGNVICLERAAMLAGTPGARSIVKSFTEPNNAGFGFWLPLPADADGVLPPSGQRCPLFSYTDNGWGGGQTDAVKIWSMGVTWGTTPAATITVDATLPTAAFDASYDQNWDDITQPGNQKLDGLGGVCMYRAQWNSFIGTNRVVLNWAVKISSSQRSIKWVELRQDQVSGTWSLYQEGTYTPDAANRWNGSIAMDCNGDIALCYAKASSSIPASLAYTGRIPTDPLGTMSLSETVVFTGIGSLTGGNRFGDYSQTSIDPVDGNTFWHTGMYARNGSKTGIYSFQIAPCSTVGAEDENIHTPTLSLFLSGKTINVNAQQLPSNDENVVQLYDVNGKLISYKTIKPTLKSYETTIDANGLSSGIYIVRIGTPDFQKVAKIAVP